MKLRASSKVLCAFCKLEHRVYFKKEVGAIDLTLLLTITGVLAFTIWGGPDLRSLAIFGGAAFMLQVFLRVRYRESVKCPHCGFDPILYKKNPTAAAQVVKQFLEQRKNNPQYLLMPQPRITPIYLGKDQIKALGVPEGLAATNNTLIDAQQ